MLQNSTNVNFKRALLQSFDGLTNASLKQPLFAMLETEGDNDTRAQLVNALRRFTDDPDGGVEIVGPRPERSE